MTSKNLLLKKIKFAASFPQTPVSLKQMVDFGRHPSATTLLRGSQFLHRELPVRLAHRVLELENLPYGLSDMPAIRSVKDLYTRSFQDLIELDGHLVGPSGTASKSRPTTNTKYFVESPAGNGSTPVSDKAQEYLRQFTSTTETLKKRHDSVQVLVAQGIRELREHWKATGSSLYKPIESSSLPLPLTIETFLDRFYLSRIGMRMLTGQHIALCQAYFDPASAPKDYVGIICTNTHVGDIAQDAIDNARFICSEYFSLYAAPEVHVIGTTEIEFMYVPAHLHHMLFELLKNSLRAVVERYGPDAGEFPPIKLTIVQGKEDITIKISDEGGGISRSALPVIWSYMYTTAETPDLFSSDSSTDRVPMAGYGFGLPLSRLYARYFGGNLKLVSMEGSGTDAYLHLCRLSDNDEPLT